MGIRLTRYCSNHAQMQYTTNKYKRELTKDIDLTQCLNTLSKIESMAIVTRDRIPTGEETLQELEEDFQRMNTMRDVRRAILANSGIVEIILRNFEYFPNHEGATRASFRAMAELTKHDCALQRLIDASIQEEKEYDRRVAGVKVKEIEYTRVDKKRGLGVLNSAIREKLPSSDSMKDMDNIDPSINKYVQETKSALEYVMEAELSPHLPLKFCRAIALFQDDEIVQEYAEDISDALRGVWNPIERLVLIIQQANTYIENKYPTRNTDPNPVPHGESNDGHSYGSKYSVQEDCNDQTTHHNTSKPTKQPKKKRKRKGKQKHIQTFAKYKKGERIQAHLKPYWRKEYKGTVLKVKRLRRSGGSRVFVYRVKFDDGEIIKDIKEQVLRPAASLTKLTLEECMRQILRIAAYPRWRTRPDVQTLSFRAMKLILDCGDRTANQKMFVFLDGVNITLSAMRLFPNAARLNIRAMQLMISVVLGPTRALDATHFRKANQGNRQGNNNDDDEYDNDYKEVNGHDDNGNGNGNAPLNNPQPTVVELESRCAKAFGIAGAIKLLCEIMRVNFVDPALNSTVRKQGVWGLGCLAIDRNNIKMMESAGAMYVLKLAAQDSTIVIPRKLKLVDWKALREARLAGGIDDEVEKLTYLSSIFVDCLHTRAKQKCTTPSHCKQCFINKYATGFWHRIGCKEHPGNTDVPSLLAMQQLNIERKRHWANVENEKNEQKRKEENEKAKKEAGGDTSAKMLGLEEGKKGGRTIPEEWL